MKKYRLFSTICLVAALLLSSCSQEELGEQGMALPEGEYPLQIGSVTLTAEVSEQPWTRVAESADGMSSVWEGDERIGIRIGDNEETGIYVVKLDAEGTVMEVIPEKPVYWKNTQPATVTAWYPVDEELDFTHQDQGLTYLLQATGDGDYQSTPINLNFTHQLAKVRVVLEGTKASEVQAVTVRSYEGTNNEQGTPNGRIGTDVYVPMLKATYGGETYWEANLLKGYLDADNTFRVSSDGKNFVQAKLTTDVDITPGHVHTIKIDVGEAKPVEGDISDDDTYIVSGTRTEPVTITGGDPTIYLKDANINVSEGPAISITGGNPTIYVLGNNSIVSNYNNASYYRNYASGIYVATGSSLTISGNNLEEDVLRVTGATDGAAIGGYSTDYGQHTNCGSITISNVTVYAEAYSCILSYAPGIGSTGNACGTITITNAIVHARSFGDHNYGAPAIGAYESVPKIVISGSEIHAYRGSHNGTSYADYIGQGGNSFGYHGGDIQWGTGSITNTTVYKGTYDYNYDTSSNEGSVYYDDEGNEIPQ